MELVKRTLVISSDTGLKKQLRELLKKEGCEVSFLKKNGNLFLSLKDGFNIVILDMDGVGSKPFDLIENIRILSPSTPVVALTSSKRFDLARNLLKHSVYDLLIKPVSEKEFLKAFFNALHENVDRILKSRMLKVAQQRSYDIMLLKEITESTAKTKLNVNYLSEKIAHLIAELIDVKIVSIMMLDEKTGTLSMSAYKGPYEQKDIKRAKLRLGESVSGFVAKTGEPLLINDIENDPMFSQSKWARGTYNTKSLLTVPIKLKDDVIGIINVNNKTDGSEFNENDKNILMTISNQVAMSIENFRLYAKIKEKADQLEISNKKLTDLSNTKSELLCNLSHELKTPLTSVIGYLELLINFAEGETEETKMNYIRIILHEAKKIGQLIERILNFFNLETNRIEWEMAPVNLNSVIDDIITMFQNTIMKDKIKLTYENKFRDIMVYADSRMLKKAFEHLFENAVKFNDKRRVIIIKVEKFKEKDSNFIRVSIFNTGKKIKDEHIEKIFEDFYQPGNILTDKPKGVGLGLATVQGIFNKHKGNVKLGASNKNGNTFICVLPVMEDVPGGGTAS